MPNGGLQKCSFFANFEGEKGGILGWEQGEFGATPSVPELVVLDRDFLSNIDGGKIPVHRRSAVDDPASFQTILPPALVDVAADHDGGRILFNEVARSEEHTSELQSLAYLVCRLLLEKK